MIARFALAREESRGSHRRMDFAETDPGLDGMHLVAAGEGDPEWRTWA